jgi:hypothetical protein
VVQVAAVRGMAEELELEEQVLLDRGIPVELV